MSKRSTSRTSSPARPTQAKPTPVKPAPARPIIAKKTTAKKAFPTWAWGVIALAVVVIVALVALNQPAAPVAVTPLAKEITVQQAAQMQKDGAFVLDVREPSEWNEVHIPGATLIPLGQLASRVNEVPKDKDVVVICRSGNRSQEGRDILLNSGFQRVTSVAGGVNDWKAKGFPTVSGP